MIGRITQGVKLVGKLSQKTSLVGRLSIPSAAKPDHYITNTSFTEVLTKTLVRSAASSKTVTETAIYPYEIITEEE